MKRQAFSRLRIHCLEDSPFWDRCLRRRKTLFLLFLFLSVGVLAGAVLAVMPGLLSDRSVFPLFFSGIPSPKSGFISCFSTFLLNLLVFLTIVFLLGMTVFGIYGIPLLVLGKGITVSLGVFSFLWVDGLAGWEKSALLYAPAAAASLILFLLFGVRAFVFSDCLRKISFSSDEGCLDFHLYWKDYLCFLCFSVAVSIGGGALVSFCSLFLP